LRPLRLCEESFLKHTESSPPEGRYFKKQNIRKEEEKMEKRQLLMILIVLSALVFSSAYGESEKKPSVLNLTQGKCTKCHEILRVQDLHKTKKEPKAVVKEMQKKKGADISDEQAADIARFLEAPYWQQPLIRSKCTKCHPLNSIFNKCAEDPFAAGIPKKKIERMQERGADITDKQVDEIYKILQW
jgi:hypothetical protein